MNTGDVHPFETAVVDALDDEGGVSRIYYLSIIEVAKLSASAL